LKPQNGRFAPDANPNSKYEGFVVLDTQTGVLCNAVGGEIKVIPFPLCSELLRDVFLVILGENFSWRDGTIKDVVVSRLGKEKAR